MEGRLTRTLILILTRTLIGNLGKVGRVRVVVRSLKQVGAATQGGKKGGVELLREPLCVDASLPFGYWVSVSGSEFNPRSGLALKLDREFLHQLPLVHRLPSTSAR